MYRDVFLNETVTSEDVRGNIQCRVLNIEFSVTSVTNYFKAFLIRAASEGQVEVIHCLIERKVDLNVANNFGRMTPICAASEGYLTKASEGYLTKASSYSITCCL